MNFVHKNMNMNPNLLSGSPLPITPSATTACSRCWLCQTDTFLLWKQKSETGLFCLTQTQTQDNEGFLLLLHSHFLLLLFCSWHGLCSDAIPLPLPCLYSLYMYTELFLILQMCRDLSFACTTNVNLPFSSAINLDKSSELPALPTPSLSAVLQAKLQHVGGEFLCSHICLKHLNSQSICIHVLNLVFHFGSLKSSFVFPKSTCSIDPGSSSISPAANGCKVR